MSLVPGPQVFYSHHDRQHEPDKRPTKRPDAVAGKLHTGAQHLGLIAAKFTPWVPTVLAQTLGQIEGGGHHGTRPSPA